jgi:biopolymer transport protein ExbB
MRTFCLAALLLTAVVHADARAAWSPDWAHRKKITLDTTPAGADVKSELAQAPVLVRLYSGRFAFTDAKEDGSDLRFVAGDDKTLLKHHIEQFDSVNELGLIWVELPRLAPGSKLDSLWLYYGNDKATPRDDPKGTYDASQVLVLHFAEKDGLPRDSTAYGNNASQSAAKPGISGPVGPAVALDGTQGIVIPASPSLQFARAMTFSAWVKIAEPQTDAQLFLQQDGAKSVRFGIAGDKLVLRVTGGAGQPVEAASAAPVTAGSWHHVAFALGDRTVVYLDGKEAAAVGEPGIEIGGEISIGGGLKGELDEVQLAKVARSSDWIALAFSNEGPEDKLLGFGADEDAGGGGGSSYFGILLSAVTLDGWVVIGILMFMMVLSFIVMIGKGILISRTEKANLRFRDQFAASSGEMLELVAQDIPNGNAGVDPSGTRGEFANSSLYRVYTAGMHELRGRFARHKEEEGRFILSPQAIGAIKATVDAGMVRETERLNGRMVLLTIAISGGPFLGLLGTVVGVMITFAAIAASGDVNVNSIAPGIAAALVATVAGLAVAIPSLFGYNYLASKVRSIRDDMAVFADEFIARLAEDYAP